MGGMSNLLTDRTLKAILLAPNSEALTAAAASAGSSSQNPAVISAIINFHTIPTTTSNAVFDVSSGSRTYSTRLSTQALTDTVDTLTIKPLPGT